MKLASRALPLAGLCAAIVLAGCTTVESTRSDGQLVSTESGVSGVVVENVRKVVENGLLRVQLDLRNTAALKRTVQARFEWVDASGFVVASDTTAAPLTRVLAPGQTATIGAVAPSPRPVDFRLQLSKTKNP